MYYAKDYTKMALQMTTIYKSSMDQSINAMNMIREGTQRMINHSLDQSPWIPEEGRNFVKSWLTSYNKGYDDLRVAADEQYKKLEAFVDVQKNS